MKITWDETKRLQNLRDHQLDFRDARFDYDEWRFITVGLLAGRVVVLSHTQRGNSLRMISMREGSKREEIRFFKNLRA